MPQPGRVGQPLRLPVDNPVPRYRTRHDRRMRLWLTLVDSDTPTSVDLLVQAPPRSQVGDLRPHLPGRPARAEDRPDLYVGCSRLPDDAELGRPPLLDGGVIHVGRPASVSQVPTGLLHLEVTSGPDAGGSHPLTTGSHVVGRSPTAQVRIEDPQLSRTHLLIEVTDSTTQVSDLGTTNGSRLGDEPLMSTPRAWPLGVPLRAGDSLLLLRTHGSLSAATTFDGVGGISLNRRPRDEPSRPDVVVRFPDAPPARTHGRLPLLAMIVPLMVAGPMAWFQHSPAYLLFGLMSPAMMVGSFVSERRGGRRVERQTMATWRAETDRAATELRQALAAETSLRRRDSPDLAEMLRTAQVPLARLWERRRGDADFGCLRVGLASVSARARQVGPTPAGPPRIADVPLLLSLVQVGVVGLAGPRAAVTGLARSLVAQLAAWHSPRDLQLMILVAEPEALESWTWAARLPQARVGSLGSCRAWFAGPALADQVRQRVIELTALLDERLSARAVGGADRWSGRLVVVLLDGARSLRQVPGVARILALGPGVGLHTICVDQDRSHLPVECGAVIEMSTPADGAESEVSVSGALEAASDIVLDGVSLAWAEQFSRAMAPLRDATPESTSADPPDRAGLVDLFDLDPTNAEALENRWRTAPRSTRAVLGVTADGPFDIDLRHDGPHILVGGTTGAGKSELLRTLITSLAVVNAPDQLGFVLVDYKGGAAFDACAELPHTLGLVTDLDPQLAERALRSMQAELTRREMILRSVGAKDLDDYQRLAGSGHPILPRLVLVIDEFRMLAEELPAFIDGLVRIAAVGRSLGVHLVLATQRPAGIVSADIAANVNLRIALRVRDERDSEDVIEARDAATISSRTPGRAFARSGANPLVSFQTARVAGAAIDHPSTIEVTCLAPERIGDPPTPPTPSGHDGHLGEQGDLTAIVTAARRAADRRTQPASRRPWLPPLPEVVTIHDLDRPLAGPQAPYAVVDRPDRQAQETIAWDLAHGGHLVIAGTSRSGRSTCLRTIAGSLAASLSPQAVHLHVIEGAAGTLQAIRRLPHAGVVVSSEQTSRGVRLLDRLLQEVNERQSALSTAGFGSLAEQHAEVDATERMPYLVLLIDGWESLVAAWEQIDHGRPVESLQLLMREGIGVGLRVVITGDRSLLMSRLASLVGDKLLLRLADPADLVLCGIPATALPRHLPPGRGLRIADHAEVQVALLADDVTTSAQTAALDRIAEQSRADPPRLDPVRRPLRIETLPARAGYAEVAASAADRAGEWTLVGLGGDAAEPIGLSLPGPFTVAGPPRSGRSTTLVTMTRWLLARHRPVIAVIDDREPSPWSALSSLPELHTAARFDAEAIGRLLDLRPDAFVVIDDVEGLVDTEAEDVVRQWFKRTGSAHGTLIVSGTAAEMAASFRGLVVLARRSGRGVLLNPTTYAEGELLGARIAPGDDAPRIPGRGLLVQDGHATPVQVACG